MPPTKSEEIKLYVESDGHLHNTRVFDQYGRELICRSVQWRIEGGRKGDEVGIVTLELYGVEVKVNQPGEFSINKDKV